MPTQHAETSFLSQEAWGLLTDRLGLSPRERQIAEGIVADFKESAIAAQLNCSPHTVHTHTERLYRKLDVCSRLQLVTRLAAMQLRLIAEPDSPLPPVCAKRSAGRCPLSS